MNNLTYINLENVIKLMIIELILYILVTIIYFLVKVFPVAVFLSVLSYSGSALNNKQN